MFNKFYEPVNGKISQADIYSPTPKIKIKRWYQKLCFACNSMRHEYGDYDSVGWYECEESEKLGNLKSFSYCSAKSCNKFNPKKTASFEDDYWSMLMDFEKVFGENGSKKLFKLIDFNERMGDYRIGRI